MIPALASNGDAAPARRRRLLRDASQVGGSDQGLSRPEVRELALAVEAGLPAAHPREKVGVHKALEHLPQALRSRIDRKGAAELGSKEHRPRQARPPGKLQERKPGRYHAKII